MRKNKLCFVTSILTDKKDIDLILEFIDYLSSKWTSRQSSLLLLALCNFSQTEIAKEFSIAQQTVSGQLEASG